MLSENNTSGTIESPGFSSGGYNASVECLWLLAYMHSDVTIVLDFTALSIERHGECAYDYVEVFDCGYLFTIIDC